MNFRVMLLLIHRHKSLDHWLISQYHVVHLNARQIELRIEDFIIKKQNSYWIRIK